MKHGLSWQRVRERLVGAWGSPQTLAALSVFAAGVILLEGNALSSRNFRRFDWSAGSKYSLSAPTKELLDALRRPVELIVLLPGSDPTLIELRQLIESYQARTAQLRVRFVDPDREPAEFLALGRKYEIGAQKEDNGELVPETAILVRSGSKKWFVRPDELLQYDSEGRRHSRMEAALSEALAQVQTGRKGRLCFLTGHGEKSLDDVGPTGLAELASRLNASNIETTDLALGPSIKRPSAEACDAIAVVGPDRSLPAEHLDFLTAQGRLGVDLLLFLDPLVNPEGKLEKLTNDRLDALVGAAVNPGFVLDKSPDRRLSEGIGEAFIATVRPHPVTRGLSGEALKGEVPVVVVANQPIEILPGSTAAPILTTSPQGVVLSDLRRLDDQERAERSTIVIGSAVRFPLTPSPGTNGEFRAVVLGGSQVADNTSFRDPSRFGNQRLVESAISWSMQAPQLVSVPDGPPLTAGLTLTEASLGRLLRYVLVFMPLTAAGLGGFVLHRRRRLEHRRREEARS